MHVVATAGHVDHGKSTLVKALTGTDPDRFAEEKERGLTIDLGFASTTLPRGRGISIIDVPGHVRFLKNMLAGVGAVDASLFVVAATEGWKPQSEEHLRILELMGARHGLIAMTKVGIADDDLIELATLDITEHVEGTFLEGAEIVAVDALAGIGVDDLLAALDRLLDETPEASDLARPRMWIDRSFAAKGAGTVVTGTLTGGRVRVDDELILAPPEKAVRIRGLQSLYADRTKVGPGNRVAMNINGVSHDEVKRGDVVVKQGQWLRTDVFDASLTVLDAVAHPVSRRGAHLLYIGSGEHPVRMRILGPDALLPGNSGSVRLFLPSALPLVPGDRFVLREAGRGETIGGGEVLDVEPILPASKARPDRDTDRVIDERGWVEVDHLTLLTGEQRTPTIGNWVVSATALESKLEQLRAQIDQAGALGLDIAVLDEQGRAAIELLDGYNTQAGRVRPADTKNPAIGHPFLVELRANLLTPPSANDIDRGELRELVRRGEVFSSEGVFFAIEAVDAAIAVVKELLSNADGFTVSDFRTAAAISRKYALPLLNYLDDNAVTRRRDDLRIAGPRMPRA
ncbi:MAG: selenocysteine-specific translation elongation factor [Acidimicrobiales bacterium]